MKCPKCSYLGFETGDRCKNCGYDFSLIAAPAAAPDPDLTIRTPESEGAAPEIWLDRLDRSVDAATRGRTPEHFAPGEEPASAVPASPPLPLFNPDGPDDLPLVALPTVPRAPLSVRRTPEAPPRLRAVARLPRRADQAAPALDFHDDVTDRVEDDLGEPAAAPAHRCRPPARVEGVREVGGRRLTAALIDHGLLFAVDAAIVYFTLRMAGLAATDLALLPPGPMLTFMALLKLAYFTAFTAVGGQTIGKMAVGIRVISERGTIDSARAIRRTLAGLLSILPLGLGFLPAFFGADRRTFHDRLTQTRVVGLPSA